MTAEVTVARRRTAAGGRPRIPGDGPVIYERATRAQGRGTVARLLAAGLAEFGERGFQAVTVDDIVRRANASHGTFYLYFANKDDFFGALSQEALRAMDHITREFPVVTPDQAGRTALRKWVGDFCDTYTAHATVLGTLSQAQVVGRDAWENGLGHLFRLVDAMSMGMAVGAERKGNNDGGPPSAHDARLSAVACLMMLERVNYLLSSGVRLPRADLIDRMTAIIAAAFQPHRAHRGRS
jgi:AcrR family transcriptional regulator